MAVRIAALPVLTATVHGDLKAALEMMPATSTPVSPSLNKVALVGAGRNGVPLGNASVFNVNGSLLLDPAQVCVCTCVHVTL